MSSAEIKESLDEWLSELSEFDTSIEDIEPHLGKWKRLSKKRDELGRENRIFINTGINKKVLVVDDDIRGFIVEGNYAFHIYTRPTDNWGIVSPCMVWITNLKYFKIEKALNDWHMSEVISLPEYLDEVCEADFASSKSIEETRNDLLKFGLVEDEEFSHFMQQYC